ncbi:MAG: hypothetical protein K2K56_09450 [Lachnospiraceae bacterium]|nr:hypothetical protein [Lachnospiraceae bacterium]
MTKKRRTKKKNQGNSFIMVVATVSFLAILVAAILVAVALCYRLKAYDINARDNFYYLEQAMDEIYAGVGADSMKTLNQAYDETLEVMVYYDTKTRAYVTMDNQQANQILKTTYMRMLQNDDNYKTQSNIEAHLISFLSYPYDDSVATGLEGVQLTVGGITTSDDDLTICNIVLKRCAKYSTVNARSVKESGTVAAADTFIQTITTDLVIGKPEFDVRFDGISADLNDLYEYSMVADRGVEIIGKDGKTALGNSVNITGNVYAASDFYNKSYDEDPGVVPTVGNAPTTVEAKQIQQVNSYDDDQLKKCNGVNVNSMYSGFYVDGATVVMASDRIIVPGSLALMNCADVTISNIANSSIDYADVWADGIVLDGFALRKDISGETMRGATLNMKARAYIYDDLEVNANSGNVLINGEYYGYNYASTDNRTYTTASITKGIRKFTKHTDNGITDGQGIEGQAHYNSSAIILNGEDTTLDFSLVKALYVAGQSYIELSKDTKESETAEKVTYTVQNGSATETVTDEIKPEVDSYLTQKTQNGEISDNYTVKTGSTEEKDKTPIQDYRTGEAISIKSNQLAYIPNGHVHDEEDGLWLEMPERLKNVDAYKGIWSNFDKIPVIKTVVSGKTKYFLDFSKSDLKNTDVMNKFIADYAALFDQSTITGSDGKTAGETYGLVNITDYDYFKVKMLNVSNEVDDPYKNVYTNSAITTKVDDSFTIVANSNNIAPLVKAAENINGAIVEGDRTDTVSVTGDAPIVAQRVSSKLQDQYKEMKWLLTNKSSNGDFVTEAHLLKEEVITPINHYFDFSLVNSANSKYCAMKSGYGVWVSEEKVEIGASSCKIGSNSKIYDKPFKNGKVRGIVIAKGDVTFQDDVEEFEGLIVTGGKIIINNFNAASNKTSMSFLANEEIIKTVLRECDNSRGENKANNFGFVCDMFRQFTSQYVDPAESGDIPVVSLKDISAVQFEDILSFRNWKKNVD